jgi:hypothetical protein
VERDTDNVVLSICVLQSNADNAILNICVPDDAIMRGQSNDDTCFMDNMIMIVCVRDSAIAQQCEKGSVRSSLAMVLVLCRT